ncbi:MAG: DUF3137 domain-containing protein [Planctomycetes bacterium]|nr:DUF3137 domain-containing protein [Planctomycetota bacterium]
MSLLKKWFHDSRPEIWKQLSTELGGEYTKGTWKGGERLEVRHGEWTLTLDTYVVPVGKVYIPMSRMRAPFVNADGLRVRLHRESFFSSWGRFLGMQDISIGVADFDAAFVIRGSDERKVRAFLANERLRALMLAEKDVQLSVEDDEGWFGKKFPENTDELRMVWSGHEKDAERIKRLFELFSEALDQLCRIGSAYERRPDVKL